MKRLLAILALALAACPLPAETVSLAEHGSLDVTLPKGWTLASQKEEDSGVAITVSPPADVNAKCLINVTYVPDPHPMNRDEVEQKVREISEQFVDASVEKRQVLHDLAVGGGAIGSYCMFTDASLVGQPPKRDSYSVIAVGIIRFTDEVVAAVSLGCDSAKGADYAQMLSILSSARLSAGRPGSASP